MVNNTVDFDRSKSMSQIIKPDLIEESGTFSSISPKRKYITTIILCYMHFAFGIGVNILSPALIDLKIILGVSTETMSIYFTVCAFGYITGVSFGFLYKYINRHLTLCIMLTVMSCLTISIPHVPNFYVLCPIGFLVDCGAGVWNAAQNVWFMDLWQEKSGPILQLSQLLWALGSFVAPLITKPFIMGEQNIQINNSTFNISNNYTVINDDSIDYRRSQLAIPYAIAGAMELIGAIALIILYCYKPYVSPDMSNNDDMKMKDVNDNNEVVKDTAISDVKLFNSKDSPTMLAIAMCALFFASYTAVETAFASFSPTFSQYITLKLSASRAADIFGAYALAYTIGLGWGAIIALKISSKIMIAIHISIMTIAHIFFLFSDNSETLLWIGNICLGFGFSIMFPAIFAFVREYLDITDRIASIFLITSGAIGSVEPILIGKLIQSYPMSMIYVEIFALILYIALYFGILILVKVLKKRESN